MTEVLIESKKNESLSRIRALKEKKYRKEYGQFFLEGQTLFFEALSAGLVPSAVVLSLSASASLQARVRAALSEMEVRVLVVEEDLYLSLSAEHAPQGVLAVFSVRDLLDLSQNGIRFEKERYIILEKMQDPGNVGTMLRSAAAFGYRGAILCASADLFSPKTVRACMGALFRLELLLCASTEEAFALARARGLKVYTTSPHAEKKVSDADYTSPFALLFGNEGAGASDEALSLCDEVLTIPMQGMESLNAAGACAVALYESVRGEVV